MRIRTHRFNEPKYQPRVLIDDAALQTWYKHKIEGLDIQCEATLAELLSEISSLEDLLGMSDADIDSVKSAMSTAIRNHRGNSTQSFKLPTRTCLRLKGLIKVFEYMSLVRRDIKLDNIKWPHVLGFLDEWKALQELAKVAPPPVPKYVAQKGMPKHMHSLMEFFGRVYGNQYCPLSYFLIPDSLRDESSPENAAELLPGRFFSDGHLRIADELQARASRSTPAAQADNELIFKYVADSLIGTSGEALLQDFEKTRDGLGLWNRLQETQCTDAVHESLANGHLNWLQTACWNGPQSGDLSPFVDKHRRQYALYSESAEKANMQMYTDFTRVKWLFKALSKCTDMNLRIRINAIKDDDSYVNDFEKTAQYIARTDYEGKGKKRPKKVQIEGDTSADIGAVGGGGPRKKAKKGLKGSDYQSQLNLDGGKGPKTGVALRWYDDEEFDSLTKEQKQELRDWRATNKVSIKACLSASKKNRQKKNTSALKDGFAKIAALFKQHAPEAAAQVDSIVQSVEAEVGSVTVQTPTPSGEDDTTNNETANQDIAVADVGGSAVKTAIKEETDDEDEEGSIPKETEEHIQKQVEISAAVGLQSILKKSGKKNE